MFCLKASAKQSLTLADKTIIGFILKWSNQRSGLIDNVI